MKKKLLAMIITGVLACSMAACGSQPVNDNSDRKEDKKDKDKEDKDKDKDKDKEDKDKEDKDNKEGNSSEANGTTSDIVISVEGNEWRNVRTAYNELVKNMKNYVAECEALNQDYYAYDYMYFDYDEDGENEVILYLGYRIDIDLRDVVFMDYFEDRNEVGIRGIEYASEKNSSFYAEYDSKLAKYSWITSPYESQLWFVAVRNDEIALLLEETYDYVISDIEEAGLHALPLYGDWEMLPED